MSEEVKPCTKCGAQDRYKNGRCGPCQREHSRKYYEENSEKVLEYQYKYNEENREKRRESQRKYYKENPGVYRRNQRNRRARKMNPQYPNDKLSRGLKRRLMKEQRGLCAYAHAPLAYWCAIDVRKENHMDHIVPLAKGGRNIDSNMQITCPGCNTRKSDSDPEDFAKRVGLLL
jgi:5-methylcytosine-specific restriction endonuclease McrA